jgi:hypothetical protein
MTDHPITPPPELVQHWYDNMGPDPGPFESFAIAAARWGADQELEVCCKLLELSDSNAREFLTAARRPKPPSLKKQALMALEEAAYMADDAPPQGICSDQIDVIRRALEALPE